MSPYIGLQIKPQMSRIWKLDFHLWTEAKDSPQPIRDSLARATGQSSSDLGATGPVHRCGLNLNPEHAFPRPMGRKWANKWLHRTRIVRSNRGASQQQQPHKSNSSGHVKPMTPLLARKKTHVPPEVRLPLLVHHRGVRLANSRYTKLCHKGRASIINHKT